MLIWQYTTNSSSYKRASKTLKVISVSYIDSSVTMKWIILYSIVMAATLTLGSAGGDTQDDGNNRYGLDVDRPGYSCADIYEKNPTSHGKSGHYLIKTNDLYLSQCDMETEYDAGKKKGWLQIADFDLSVKSECPDTEEWKKIKVNGIEMCRSVNDTEGCYSAIFSVNGTKYRKIRGMVRGYQKGSTDGFDHVRYGNYRGINTPYVDGVSITLGNPRKHVWTYVVGCSDDDNHATSNCPCAAVPGPAPHFFVGEHYYCESGNRGPFEYSTIYTDDPLWDGAGCFHSNNNCCTNVGLPWFNREFPTTQDEDIEVRICTDQTYGDEAVLVDQLKLFVQ